MRARRGVGPWRPSIRLGSLLTLGFFLSWLTPQDAAGQFGYGFGFYPYEAPSVGAINERANIAGSATFSHRKENLTAPFTPRDTTYFERFDVQSRQSVDANAARIRAQRTASNNPAPAPGSAPPSMARPVLPLESFFDKYEQLVWPADAPSDGQLAEKRSLASKSSQEVLKEVKTRGFATVGHVTDARNKLIDYGQPALKFLQDHTTPRIADGFHLFLLSMYESLAQAVNPAAPTKP